ncbi:MAG: serine/threonine protein kinase, partial [Myxococcales bacterium]|nr:serine/threonine protein kinase [Myxococcales bacterium]
PVEPAKWRPELSAEGSPDEAETQSGEAETERGKGPWLELRERVWEAELAHVRDPDNNKPVEIDRFEILRTIGYGGMGVVFEANDPKLRRKVALKLWSDKRRTDTGPKILGEAWALAKLMHPNVTAVYELGEYDGHPYLVMEYVPGVDAHNWFAACWQEAVDVYIQAGRGLAAAHAVGLLHNDVKPSNILVSDTVQVKLTDFGLASSMPTDDGEDKFVCGTPLYMAPEFNRGPASDQFSLCASLYQALYGVPPYVGKNHLHLLLVIDQQDPQVGVTLPGIPERVRAAVHKGIAAHPAERHESVAALVAELEQCAGEQEDAPASEAASESMAAPVNDEGALVEPAVDEGARRSRPFSTLLVMACVIFGALSALGAQAVVTSMSRPKSGHLARTGVTVEILTKLAVVAAEQGDGEQAMSLLNAARTRAYDGTEDEKDRRLLAERADEVGLSLYEHQQWLDAVEAHLFAAAIHGELSNSEAYTLSMQF